MDFNTAVKYIAVGYRARRTSWALKNYISNCCGVIEMSIEDGSCSSIGEYISYLEDLLSNDWVIITDGIIKQFPITYSN